VSMISAHHLKIIDRLLRDVMTTAHEPFGGKCMLIGGDFRQVLPIVVHGTKFDIINATIKRCFLWQHFKSMKLTINIRAINDPDYHALLMEIGEGRTIIEPDTVV